MDEDADPKPISTKTPKTKKQTVMSQSVPCDRAPLEGVRHRDVSRLAARQHQGYCVRTTPLHLEHTHTLF
jgi:hypothetical protein